MADFRGTSHRAVAVCLGIGGALGALYGFALLASAVSGIITPSSILLGGLGFILLVLSLLLLAFAIRQWTSRKPGQHT
jgi:hypothetical protein